MVFGLRTEGSRLILFLLRLQPFDVLAASVDLVLVTLNLLLLAVVGVFLSLQLVADQCAGAESEAAADCRARSRMPHRRADESASRRPAEDADAGAFFSCTQRTARAARDQKRPREYQYRCLVM